MTEPTLLFQATLSKTSTSSPLSGNRTASDPRLGHWLLLFGIYRREGEEIIKAGKEKHMRFGEVVQAYKYRLEKSKESSEVHLNWRLGTCKNTLSIIIEYLP